MEENALYLMIPITADSIVKVNNCLINAIFMLYQNVDSLTMQGRFFNSREVVPEEGCSSPLERSDMSWSHKSLGLRVFLQFTTFLYTSFNAAM